MIDAQYQVIASLLMIIMFTSFGTFVVAVLGLHELVTWLHRERPK